MFIPAAMYPAQSMRNFVCDRLTAAAREIVGAFEKRIEDYEAEIARQRRMLDTVFTPETKFHRPDKDVPCKEAVRDQHRLSSQEQDFPLASSLVTRIKDEHEEIGISQEPLEPAQSTGSPPRPAPSPTSDPPETTEPGGSPYISSEKDTEPEPDRESSAATLDLEGLEPENEDQTAFTDRGKTPTGDVESNPDDGRAERTNQEDVALSLDQNCTNGSLHHNGEAPTSEPVPESSSFQEETERGQTETPDGKSCEEEASDSNPNPAGTDEDRTVEGTQKSVEHEELQLGSPEHVEESATENDGEQNSTENVEQTSLPDATGEENQHGGAERSEDQPVPESSERTDQNTETSPKRTERSPETSNARVQRRRREGRAAPSRAVETRKQLRQEERAGPREEGPRGSSQLDPTCGWDGSATNEGTHPGKSPKDKSSSKPGRRRHGHKETAVCEGRHDDERTSGRATSQPETSASSPAKPGKDNKSTRSRKRPNQGASDPQQKRQKDGSPSTARTSELLRPAKTKAQKKSDWGTSSDGAEDIVENPYKCDRCGKVMSNFKNYKFHMKSHTVEKTYKCQTCGKMFRESWDLNKHLVIHASEKPYKCDTCGNGFNRRYNLDLHRRVHTGEKPFKCSLCSKSFSSCVNMKKHQRVHTGEKPYICNDCGKEFADSSAFKNHQRVHTGERPFKCTLCKRKFATRTTLKRHTRTHTGEKPYQCSVCDKKFGHKSDLKGHLRLHTGEKPYECRVCDDKFSTWLKLHKHKRVHTEEAAECSSSE